MEFQKLQSKVIKNATKYGKKYGVEINSDFAFMKLYEEMGEFAEAMLINQKKCRPEKFENRSKAKKRVAKELADIVGLAMINAYLLDIDLEDSIEKLHCLQL